MTLAPMYYQAQCILTDPLGESGVAGTLFMREIRAGLNTISVEGEIAGLTAGKHGFHIHREANIAESCHGAGSHFNPGENDHGAPTAEESHAGDWGNILASSTGIALL